MCTRRRRCGARVRPSRAAKCWRSKSALPPRFPEALAVITPKRMKSERRALRIRVRDLEHECSGDMLRLQFRLVRGKFCDHGASRDHRGADPGE